MFTTLIALALLAPADTPIDPIPADAIGDIRSEPGLCDGYLALESYVYAVVSGEDAEAIMVAMDQWMIDQFETGWESSSGGSARMTDEAEVVFLDGIHTCI